VARNAPGAAVIALVVGSVLVAINQGDVLLTGRWDMALVRPRRGKE
jgi:hypothetical protein